MLDSTIIYMMIFAYFLGSVPFGLLLYYLKTGKDLRKEGSGNIGATNVYRVSGIKLAFITFVCDSGKTAFISLIALLFFGKAIALMVGFCAIIGHNFPCFLGFKGGKGVASSLALMFVLNWQLALMGYLVWLMILALFRTSSVSALLGFGFMSVIALFFIEDKTVLLAALMMTSLLFIKHLGNIRRIIQGTEPETVKNKNQSQYFSLWRPLQKLRYRKKDKK